MSIADLCSHMSFLMALIHARPFINRAYIFCVKVSGLPSAEIAAASTSRKAQWDQIPLIAKPSAVYDLQCRKWTRSNTFLWNYRKDCVTWCKILTKYRVQFCRSQSRFGLENNFQKIVFWTITWFNLRKNHDVY